MNLRDFRLIAAPFTPFQSNGSLHLGLVPDQAQYLIDSGVRGVFVGGTSGEGQSLTIKERIALVDKWAADDARSKLELFIHVGHNCQDDAVRLSGHALSVEADAIAMHAPTSHKQLTVDELVDFCAPIAAAASALPFYLYDMPRVTGVNISSARFLAAAKKTIPNLAGIKYTNTDVVTLQECIQLDNGGYDILWGCDEALLVGVALGASGAVGSTYNFAAPLYQRILAAVEAGNWQVARSEQALALAMIRIFEKFSTLAAIKYGMKLIGVDCGPVRPPLGNLSAADERRLRAELEHIGFAEKITAIPKTTCGGIISSSKSA
jgi:N-acetylneuraminate lyase